MNIKIWILITFLAAIFIAYKQYSSNDLTLLKLNPKLTGSNTAIYSILVVPIFQCPMSKEAKRHGGYHITMFPRQEKARDYSLIDTMKNFKMEDTRWNLQKPGITTKIVKSNSKNLTIMMIYGSKTLKKLKAFLMSPEGGSWIKPWGNPHVTLGNLDPSDIGDPSDFKKEKWWFVQLQKNGKEWVHDQRVLLRVAEGEYN